MNDAKIKYETNESRYELLHKTKVAINNGGDIEIELYANRVLIRYLPYGSQPVHLFYHKGHRNFVQCNSEIEALAQALYFIYLEKRKRT